MKCPNCRCVIPDNSYECQYCGYDVTSGSANTLTIQEYYNDMWYDKYYSQQNYYDNFNNYDERNHYYNNYYQEKPMNYYSGYNNSAVDNGIYNRDLILVAVMAGVVCLGIIFSLLLLLI